MRLTLFSIPMKRDFFDKAEAIFKSFTSSTDGMLTNKEKTIKEQQDRLNDDMDDLNERMKSL